MPMQNTINGSTDRRKRSENTDQDFQTMKTFLYSIFVACLLSNLVTAQTKINEGLRNANDQLRFEVAKELRQTEKYQLVVAQRFYAKGDLKAAMSEFEKFLTLYERSDAAPYAQLMWSHCLVRQRKVNTAIRDGYQSVIDYWPEAPEAALAAYLIGKSYKDIGEIKNSIKAFDNVREDYPDKQVRVLALWDMLDIANVHKDEKLRIKILKELTFEIKRTKANDYHLTKAAQDLAGYYFYRGDGSKGLEALQEQEGAGHMRRHGGLVAHAHNIGRGGVGHLLKKKETVKAGEKLADDLIKFINGRVPEDLEKGKAKEVARDLLGRIANLHATVKRDKEVLETYERMGKMIGMDDDVLGKIASWHKTKKRRTEARKTYERFKNKVNGLANIAGMYREDKDPDGAKNIYGKIIQLDKENEAKWASESAGVYRECKKPEEAVQIYTYVASIDQENKGKWFEQVAGTWQEAGKYEKAIESWRNVITTTGKSSHYWAIGDCYVALKDIPKGIQSYRLSDNFPSAYFRMADLHRGQKQWNEALTLYNQARSYGDGHAQTALWRIGETYEKSSRREQAIKSYQSICKLYPKSSSASRAHAHLQNKYKINITLGGAKEE